MHYELSAKVQHKSVGWLVIDSAIVEPIFSEVVAFTEASARTPLMMFCNSGLGISYVWIIFDEVLATEACSGREAISLNYTLSKAKTS